jgi:hypothetical protein
VRESLTDRHPAVMFSAAPEMPADDGAMTAYDR